MTRAHPKFADAVMPDGTLAAASDVDEAPYLTSKLTPDSTTPNKNAKSITNLDKLLSNLDKMWNKDKNGPRQVENLEEEMSAKKKGNLVEKAEDNNLVNNDTIGHIPENERESDRASSDKTAMEEVLEAEKKMADTKEENAKRLVGSEENRHVYNIYSRFNF